MHFPAGCCRRIERLGLQPPALLSTFSHHKPTPSKIIRELPVMPHAAARQHLGHDATGGTVLGRMIQVPQAAAAAAPATAADGHLMPQGQPATAMQHSSLPAAAAEQAFCYPGSNAVEIDTINEAGQRPDIKQAADQSHKQARNGSASIEKALASVQQQGAGLPAAQVGELVVDSWMSGGSSSNANQSQLPAESDACSICFCEYEASTQVKQLPCSHFFHPECIDQWLGRDNTCPLCKRLVYNPFGQTSKETATASRATNSGSSAAQWQGFGPRTDRSTGRSAAGRQVVIVVHHDGTSVSGIGRSSQW
eukprot:GHRR01020846.1.p1 GENE.GHRR01020846.1~~GHRR01020846.1.p1  ORF type:complete len:308 (+),score=108.98 GHRR01020846.1:408-1331(+)